MDPRKSCNIGGDTDDGESDYSDMPDEGLKGDSNSSAGPGAPDDKSTSSFSGSAKSSFADADVLNSATPSKHALGPPDV